MVNPCAYSCRSWFTPSDDKKSCICKQTTQACPVIDTQKEKRFDHQLDDENAIQSQSACSQTKLQANECKTTTYYTYKCKAWYKRNSEGTACEAEECGTQDNPWIWSENKVGACTDTRYAPYNRQDESGVGYDFKYGCRRKNYRPNQWQQDPAKCYGKCPENMKWDSENTKCISNTPSVTCTGTAPSWAWVITGSNTPSTTTWWSYTDSSTPGACQWTCNSEYIVNNDRTWCTKIDPYNLCWNDPYTCISGASSTSTWFNQTTKDFYWKCKLWSTTQTCPRINCDEIDTWSTLHNEYCANLPDEYHWQCQYDNDEEGYCRELNDWECQAIRSNTGTNWCWSWPYFGRTFIYKWETEPCHYCGQKSLHFNDWANVEDCWRELYMWDGHNSLNFACNDEMIEQRTYSACIEVSKDDCGKIDWYEHCKWENESGEQAEHWISICVDSDGNQVADALCTENKPQCGWDIIINKCTQYETPKRKCFETDESCQRYGGSRWYDRTACYVMDEFCHCTGVI